MKSFEYTAPKTLKDAIESLADVWGKTEVLAGGTDLVTALKQRITEPGRLVSLKNIAELKGITADKAAVQIGSLTTLAELAGHTAVKEHFPALVQAIQNIGSSQITSAGTVGGDLCQRPRCWYFRNGYGLFAKDGEVSLVREGDNRYHAIFGNDGPALFVSPSTLGPALIALDAMVNIAGPTGKPRQVSADKFFQIPKTDKERETALAPNEIVTGVSIPIKGLKNSIYEVRHRHGLDWPYVTAVVALKLTAGVASDARIVLGQVAPVPWAVPNAAKVLNGAKVDAATAARCGEAAAAGAKALSGNGYKIQMVKTAVKRAIQAVG